MEKDRSARLIAIVALVLAVTGVSIGFAVLSTNLTIEAPEAQVKANDDLFTVYFSALSNQYQAANSTVDPELGPSREDGFSGNQITVADKSTTLSKIGGTFTKPGQTITYRIGVSNQSKLDGYLTSITFNNSGSSGKIVECTPVDEGNAISEEELQKVCENIKVTVKVNQTEYNNTNESIRETPITNGQTIPLNVVITYDESATPATGDFKATFGDIVLGFKTEDNKPVQ